jgi:PAS domain-containing protein
MVARSASTIVGRKQKNSVDNPIIASGRVVVTSAELTRQFGYLRQSSAATPVFITHHGRETHVLLGIGVYYNLVRDGGASAGGAPHLPTVEDLASWIHQGCIVMDLEGRVIVANGSAHAMTKRSSGTLIGRRFYDAAPELIGSMAQRHIERATTSRTAAALDLPSAFRRDAWIRLSVYPTEHSTTLLFHDITPDVEADMLADPRQAAIEAMRAHAEVGSLRIDVRGRIEQSDEWCARALGVPQARLHEIAIWDLVPRPQRDALRETVSSVLGGADTAAFDTQFLANDGMLVGVRGTMTPLRGAYGAEGAIIVLTRAPH